jgi:hypothetical protein
MRSFDIPLANVTVRLRCGHDLAGHTDSLFFPETWVAVLKRCLFESISNRPVHSHALKEENTGLFYPFSILLS